MIDGNNYSFLTSIIQYWSSSKWIHVGFSIWNHKGQKQQDNHYKHKENLRHINTILPYYFRVGDTTSLLVQTSTVYLILELRLSCLPCTFSELLLENWYVHNYTNQISREKWMVIPVLMHVVNELLGQEQLVFPIPTNI